MDFKVQAYKDGIDALMRQWKNKVPKVVQYTQHKETKQISINHKDSVFIRDGIVFPELWAKQPEGKRILFLLKEAYGEDSDWSLCDWLKNSSPKRSIWKRVVEWSYGIINTTASDIAKYDPQTIDGVYSDYLHRIAIVNLKKSKGKPNSSMEEISEYTKYDKKELKQEIELIDPDVIVCGYTMGPLMDIFELSSLKDKDNRCDNWYYFVDGIGSRKRLVIDYYHPANQYPALLNYYGIANIYQQALKENKC